MRDYMKKLFDYLESSTMRNPPPDTGWKLMEFTGSCPAQKRKRTGSKGNMQAASYWVGSGFYRRSIAYQHCGTGMWESVVGSKIGALFGAEMQTVPVPARWWWWTTAEIGSHGKKEKINEQESTKPVVPFVLFLALIVFSIIIQSGYTR